MSYCEYCGKTQEQIFSENVTVCTKNPVANLYGHKLIARNAGPNYPGAKQEGHMYPFSGEPEPERKLLDTAEPKQWRDISIKQQTDGFFTVSFSDGEMMDNLCFDEIFCAVAHMLISKRIPYGHIPIKEAD